MSRNGVKRIGRKSEDSSKAVINGLSRQLSNSRRELELSEQICSQLEKIRRTSNTIKDVSNRLLYDIADLNDKQLEQLHQKEHESKVELKKLEQRLQMLRQVQHNECTLNVQLMPYQKALNTTAHNEKEVSFGGEDEELVNNEDEDTDIEYNNDSQSDRQSTVAESDVSDVSFDSRDSLFKDIRKKAKNAAFGGRKRVIPERFESFPQQKKHSKRLNGMP